MKTYNEIRDSLKTGDLVLFSGTSRISKLIQFFTKSDYSHVGMVIKTELGVLLWESTTLSNCLDFETGGAKRGVQVVLLSDRLAKYEGTFAIRRLDKGLGPKALSTLHDLRLELKDKPYEQDKLELIHAALDCMAEQDEDLDSIFCSELVAEFFQRIGHIPVSASSNEYTPADFEKGLCLFFRPLESITYV